jgi:protein TonB
MFQQSKRSTLSFNEIVFEHKNKAYGAFELRKSLERHQFIAFIISSSLLLFIVGGIYFAGLSSPMELIKLKDPLINERVLEYIFEEKPALQEETSGQEKSDAGRNNLEKEDLVMVPVKEPFKADDRAVENSAIDSSAFNKNGEGKSGEVIPGNGNGNEKGLGNTDGSSNSTGSEIMDVAEVNPEFPGGIDKMYAYLSNNLRYPSYLRERRVSGTVFVSFVINNKGDINQVEILKTPDDGFNEEVIRVINKMPRWNPGIQAGKPVSVRFRMPIKFTLK